jgi:hypothetical protein
MWIVLCVPKSSQQVLDREKCFSFYVISPFFSQNLFDKKTLIYFHFMLKIINLMQFTIKIARNLINHP